MLPLSLGKTKGFTLIELLVVFIIVGVLAAIALPTMLSQTAKGREAEGKSNLGTINRAQQAYRLEKARFGNIGELPAEIRGQYYTFTNGAVSDTFASHSAQATASYSNDIRDYASAVALDAQGRLANGICENNRPTDTIAPVTSSGTNIICGANSNPVN